MSGPFAEGNHRRLKMAEKPKVEFKDGKKVVEFPNGVIKEYKKDDVEKHKSFLLRHKERIDRQIGHVDEDLAAIENSKKA